MPGPKYGEFSFPSSAGFRSSGSGAASDVEKTLPQRIPGSGAVSDAEREALSEAGKVLRKARGGTINRPKPKAIRQHASMAEGLGALGQAAAVPNVMARAKRPGGATGPAAFARGGDVQQDKAMVKKGVGQHESALHRGQPKTDLKLAHGGSTSRGFNKKPMFGKD